MNTMKIKSMKAIYIQAIMFLLILGTNSANAQLTEYESMYFQNQYINNPAMAGLEQGMKFNIGYQRQWDEVPGNPILMNATFEYNSGNRTGLGLNVNSDRAGLINRTRIMATYAYHLPIGVDQKIHFGLSAGAKFSSIDYNKVIGNMDDIALQNYNEGAIFDGDLVLLIPRDCLLFKHHCQNFIISSMKMIMALKIMQIVLLFIPLSVTSFYCQMRMKT